MKTCPLCHRVYADDAQKFCLDDGATLVVSAGAPPPNPYGNRSAPTEVMYPAPPTERMGAPTAPPPFSAYTPPNPPKKSALPWILAGAGLVVVGIIVTIVLVLNKNSGSQSGQTVSSNGSTTSSGNQNWETLNGDKFSASLPGAPTKSEQNQTTAVGQIQINMYSLDRGSEAYAVGYSEYPSFVFTSKDPQLLLDSARDGGIKNINGEVLDERPIKLGDYVGREVTGKSPQGYSFIMRIYLANPREYMTMYVKQGDQPNSDNGRKFLESFRITSP